jgi:BatD DUF11 like domain
MFKLKTLLISFLLISTLLKGSVSAGELAFEVIPSSQILSIGDTLVLTMRITVYGMPERFDAEPLSRLELPGFSTISTAPTHRRGVRDDVEYEERITTFKLVAEEAGTYTIPSFEVPYNSEINDNAGALTSQELEVTVYPGEAGGGRAVGIYVIGVFILVILVSVTGFLFWFKRIKSKEFKNEEKQNISEKFSNWGDELQQVLAKGNADTFTEQAFNYVNEFIEDNYRLGLKGKKIEKRLLMLNEKKVEPQLVELFKITRTNLEEFKFGGIVKDTAELTKLLDELRSIEKYAKNKHDN